MRACVGGARASNTGGAAAIVAIAIAAAALAAAPACSTVDLGDPPADVNACRPSQAFFRDMIWSGFLDKDYGKKCSDARCHDPASQRLLVVPAMLSAAPATTPFAGGSDWDVAYRSATQQLSCTDVLGSELYARPSGLQSHGGGMLFAPDGPEAMLLTMWVAAP